MLPFSFRCVLVGSVSALSVAACSSSSLPSVKTDAGSHEDAHGTGSGTGSDGGCGTSPTCTGSVSGGISGAVTTCSVSPEDGLGVGFGEITFSFGGSGDGGVTFTGSGNVSTTTKFAMEAYSVDSGLWNDMGAAADSLWSVVTSGTGSFMAECVGVSSPDEIHSVCQSALLDVTRVDSCNHVHGALSLTIPPYNGSPEVAVQLTF